MKGRKKQLTFKEIKYEMFSQRETKYLKCGEIRGEGVKITQRTVWL
jgi:hypothetical protein